MRGQDGVDEVAIDLGEVSWDYETAAVSARPAWYGPAAKAFAVAALAVGLVWSSVPGSPPALGEPLWSSPTTMPGLGVTPNAILAAEADSIIAHEPWTGREIWRAPVRGHISYVDSSYPGVLVVLSNSPARNGFQSGLMLFEDGTGKILAEFLEYDMEALPIGRSGDLLLLQYYSPLQDLDSCRDLCTKLTAVDLRDGKSVWGYSSSQPEDLLMSTVDDQVVTLAFLSREGRVTVVDPADGSVRSVFEVDPVERGMAALVDDNLVTLRLSSGQWVVSAYGIRTQALAWQTTIESSGASGYVGPCDEGVCIGDGTRDIVLDDRTGRLIGNRPNEFQAGLGVGMELSSGVRVDFLDTDGFYMDQGMVAAVTDPVGRVLRRIDRVVPVWSEQRTELALLLRRGTEAVDLLSVNGSGEVSWLGQTPRTVDWCEVHGELLTCWSSNEPTTGSGPTGRVWVWHLPH